MAVPDRSVAVQTSLGPDALKFRKMTGREELGRLFEFELELVATDSTIALDRLVGQPMGVALEIPDAQPRHFHGIVTRFCHAGEIGRNAVYRVSLRPWLWRLGLRTSCRIFQNKSVLDIIKAVFREHGLTDFSESLSRTYPVCEYRVQYRESDLAFVCRLMELEGIYYYYKHEASKHTLVLADSASAHQPAPGYDQIPYYPPTPSGRRERDHIDGWMVRQEMAPGAVVLDDFDFTSPKADLTAKLVGQHSLAKASNEIYDYPGAYQKSADGEVYARLRLEEIYAQQELALGRGNARGLAVGNTFTLCGHPRSDQNRQVLVIAASYELFAQDYESLEHAQEEPVFRCEFSAIPAQRPFRTRSVTPKPVVHGPQTAVVVGKKGEEIWTDKHGRVKLQFHWDREGSSDENSSCWVRVGQIWAGANWGGLHIPRIGQEVIVEFLEGDPDRPLVTGRVYNADHMPPYDLPANQTQSGIRSRSSANGTPESHNEIRFEDKKGSEQVFVQAEMNLDCLVKNDETHTVKHDRKKDITNDETTTVGGNRTEKVTKDETITIDGARTEKVAKDETITIDGARTEKVAKDETITIDGARTEKVAKDETITIDGGRTERVAKDEMITIDGGRTEKVAKDETITIEGGRTEKVAKDETITIEGGRTEKVAKDESVTIGGARTDKISKDHAVSIDGGRTHKVGKADSYDVGQTFEVKAGRQLVLKAGAASITLKSSGDVEIKGVNIRIQGAANVDVKASAMLTLDGAMIKGG